MIPELGHITLIVALFIALFTASIPVIGSYGGYRTWMLAGRMGSFFLCSFVTLSFACLFISFINDDFSLTLAVQHSNSRLPILYKFSAVWGNHEGSLMLWVWILSLWMVAIALLTRQLPLYYTARVLSVMAWIAVGFLLFMLLTSNPFARTLPTPPTDGNELNPILQDPGLAIHPPMLYVGYVGLSVAFAFAMAALLDRRPHYYWARYARSWTVIAWVFLTLGIALGSWWAYYELGWGGWWFWDPVENASFMPWLVGTALLHSLIVTSRHGGFNRWSLLLAIFAFALSLLGTFLVRSGVLTSVHAFASDPSRGLFILIFLVIVICGSLFLYALRAPTMAISHTGNRLSRETFLLGNNIIMITAALTVLTGTLFPLVMEVMGVGKYSVGAPYFNTVFVPLMVLALLMMSILPAVKWKGGWKTWHQFKKQPRWGMTLAHCGFFLCAMGVTLTVLYSREHDIHLSPGEGHTLVGYHFLYTGERQISRENYTADELEIKVMQGDEIVAMLYPQKRHYPVSDKAMTEAGLQAGLWTDLYVSLGERVEGDRWALRLQVKPFVRWIWLGAIVTAIGAVWSVLSRRRRQAGDE